MGLIHWWPLNGDKNDHAGNLDLTSSSSTFVEGKINQALQLNGVIAKVINPFIGLNDWSISFWLRDNGSSAWSDFICFSKNLIRLELDNASNWRWYIGNASTSETFPATGNLFGSGTILNSGASVNTWYHVTIVKKNTNAKFYLNGVLKNTSAAATNFTSESAIMYFNSRANETTSSKMSLCDVRCYDHALSEAEIHELKSGLLVHYNFEDYTGSANLKTDPNNWTSSYSCDGSGTTKGSFTAQSDGSALVVDNNTNTRFYSSQRIPVKVGDKLTFSIKYKLVSGTEETFRWQIGEYNAAGTRVKLWWSQDTQKIKDLGGGWKLYYYHFTAETSDVSEIRFYLQDGVDYTKYTHSYYLKDFKLEKGHIDNPIFEATGYSTEYDCSGNELHGVVTGVENCCDAATGKHSAYFPLTGSQYITIPNPPLDNKNISVSVWWKSSNTSAKGGYHILFATSYSSSVSSVEISIPSSGLLRWGFVIDSYRTTNNTTITPHLNNGQWRHIVITYDGAVEKAYVDGAHVESRTRSGSISYPAIKDSYIGKYVGGSYGATDAYISDVRVYNTTLSADDVTRLYKHTVKITPEQNLLGECLIEQDSELDYYTPSTWKTTGWGGAASVAEEGVKLNAYNGWENFALLTPSNWLNQDLIFSFDYKWTGELPNMGAWVWQNTTNSYTGAIQNLTIDNNIWHHCTVPIPSAKTYVGIMIRGTDSSGLNYPLIVRNISLQPATNTGVQVYPTGCIHASRYGDSNKTRIIKGGISTANDFIEQ